MSSTGPESISPEPRRPWTGWAAGAGAVLLVGLVWAYPAWQSTNSQSSPADATDKEPSFMPKIVKTDAEWRSQLTPEQYEVTRHKGTERAFTGKYWNTKEAGSYKCVCCGAELFTSETKYDSGCGWPSFFAAGTPENVHTDADHSHGMVRTEVTCKQCGAHLGHLFDDGPAPTGQRYCMNSASLEFKEKPGGEKPPADKSAK